MKKDTHESKTKTKVIALWSTVGADTSILSYGLAMELSKYENVLLAELPCLGIPRLGFTAECMERQKNIEAEIMELEQKREINLKHIYKKSKTLGILPADVYTLPDYPITQRVALETLISFPTHLIEMSSAQNYTSLILDCQGQITTPMTFYTLRSAERILIPIRKLGDIAFSLINIKRLVQVFNFSPQKFMLLTGNIKTVTLEEAALLNDDTGNAIARIEVCEENENEVIKRLFNKIEKGIDLNVKNRRIFNFRKIFNRKVKQARNNINKNLDNTSYNYENEVRILL